MHTLHRLGAFFILVGLVSLILYAGSVVSKDVKASYLVWGIVAFVAGLLLQRNKPASDSGRFSAIRRASALSRQRREERMKNRQSKK